MAGFDLTSLLLAGAGVYALTKMSASDRVASSAGNSDERAVRAATPEEIAVLRSNGVDIKPGDQVNLIQTTSSNGQHVTGVTVNYSPWDFSGQTIWADPDDPMRLQGWYVPYVDRTRIAAMAQRYGGQNPDTFLQRVATDTSALIDPDYTMKAKDWDYYRTHYNSGEQPLPLSEAEAEERITANRYWDLVQQKGGWIQGVMLHYGDKAKLSGLGFYAGVYGGVDRRWF